MMVEERTVRRRTLLLVGLALVIVALLAFWLFGQHGVAPPRHAHQPGHAPAPGVAHNRPGTSPAVTPINASTAGLTGAVRVAHAYALSWPVGSHAIGWRALSYRRGKALIEMVAPNVKNQRCSQWYVIDVPVLGRGGWHLGTTKTTTPWFTLEPCAAPPPPFSAYHRFPS